jgi:hypothetical protein
MKSKTKKLISAISNNNINLIKKLLKHNIEESNEYTTPIIRHIQEKNYDIAELILNSNIIKYINKEQVLFAAVNRNQPHLVSLILQDKIIDLSINDNELFRTACCRGFLSIVKIFSNDGRIDISYNNNFAVCVVAENGHLDVLKFLLQDKRIDPTDYSNDAINTANSVNQMESVDILWNDIRVQRTLKKDNLALYNKLQKELVHKKIKSF